LISVNGLPDSAKNLYWYGTTKPTVRMWYANQIVPIAYDGTYFHVVSPPSATSAYQGTVKLLTTQITAARASGAETGYSVFNTLTGFVYPTAFNSLTQYKVGDCVLTAGMVYQCSSDSTGTWADTSSNFT
jgi:hypothetical protein